MTPNMAPYIALAWIISATTLALLTVWAYRAYQNRGR